MRSQAANFVRAILHGVSGAGLFHQLRYPGEPELLLGAESADEVRCTPAYKHLAQVFEEHHEREARKRELEEYYAKLYGRPRDTHEHAHEASC